MRMGKRLPNARVTVRQNGVVIQKDLELQKETPGGKKEADTPGPLQSAEPRQSGVLSEHLGGGEEISQKSVYVSRRWRET